MELSCLKTLHYIYKNRDKVECSHDMNNSHEIQIKTPDNRYIHISKRGKVVCADPTRCQDERFCLNCNICKGKACVISVIDQSNFDKLFISYLYSKMELLHDINVERAYRKLQSKER